MASWPERIVELAARCRSAPGGAARGELWELVQTAIWRLLRQHRPSIYPVAEEDILDLASEKALELLRRFDEGRWEPSKRSASEIRAYLSALARNGLVDHMRVVESKRQASVRLDPPDAERAEWLPHSEQPSIDREQYARALVECAVALRPQARAIWFLRVFYELPSRQIAEHPTVRSKVGAVDVSLARSRDHMRSCMRARGLSVSQLPAGTFVELWEKHRDAFQIDP